MIVTTSLLFRTVRLLSLLHHHLPPHSLLVQISSPTTARIQIPKTFLPPPRAKRLKNDPPPVPESNSEPYLSLAKLTKYRATLGNDERWKEWIEITQDGFHCKLCKQYGVEKFGRKPSKPPLSSLGQKLEKHFLKSDTHLGCLKLKKRWEVHWPRPTRK